jgi:hypothetical protein
LTAFEPDMELDTETILIVVAVSVASLCCLGVWVKIWRSGGWCKRCRCCSSGNGGKYQAKAAGGRKTPGADTVRNSVSTPPRHSPSDTVISIVDEFREGELVGPKGGRTVNNRFVPDHISAKLQHKAQQRGKNRSLELPPVRNPRGGGGGSGGGGSGGSGYSTQNKPPGTTGTQRVGKVAPANSPSPKKGAGPVNPTQGHAPIPAMLNFKPAPPLGADGPIMEEEEEEGGGGGGGGAPSLAFFIAEQERLEGGGGGSAALGKAGPGHAGAVRAAFGPDLPGGGTTRSTARSTARREGRADKHGGKKAKAKGDGGKGANEVGRDDETGVKYVQTKAGVRAVAARRKQSGGPATAGGARDTARSTGGGGGGTTARMAGAVGSARAGEGLRKNRAKSRPPAGVSKLNLKFASNDDV